MGLYKVSILITVIIIITNNRCVQGIFCKLEYMYTLCISNFVSVNRVTLYLKYSTSDVGTYAVHAASDCRVKTGLTLLQPAPHTVLLCSTLP